MEKNKLLIFLDVIRTLEIFIDQQYLHKLRECVGDRNLDICTYRESKWPNSVFVLKSENSSEHEYINIRKGERLQDIWLQYSLNDPDLGDKRESNRWSDAQPSLDNPSTPYPNRQRNSFLRDLYIETYPQNGNVNGLTAGVLAIPNERYRAPTSVLLTNANGKLPSRADDTLSEISRKTAEHTSYVPHLSRGQQPCIQDCNRPYGETSAQRFHDLRNVEFTDANFFVQNNLGSNFKSAWFNYVPSQVNTPILPFRIPHSQAVVTKMNVPSLDLSLARCSVPISDSSLVSSCKDSQNYLAAVNVSHRNVNCNIRKYTADNEHFENNNLHKAPIFNQVLDNPWCPRLPYNYKPFRRKLIISSSDFSSCIKKVRITGFD